MPRATVGDFYVDSYPALAVIDETPARTDFNAARNHAITLIRIHDEKTGGGKGRPPQELEALKRSALILAVTAWESFVEDTVSAELEKRLGTAKQPSDFQKVFNGAAAEWLDPQRSPKRFGPDLARWTGDEWKDRIRDSFAKTLDTFHTPNSENTSQLFQRYLDVDIEASWAWQRVSPSIAKKKLDELVELRGRVVHRGRTGHPNSQKLPNVKRTTVVDALNLVYSLVDATETKLGNAPTSKPAA